MDASPAYSEGLVAGPSGLSVNLLVCDIAAAVAFQQDVLLTKVLYHDPDFAAICGFGGQWCLHADHTYDDHPLVGMMRTTEPSVAAVRALRFVCTAAIQMMPRPGHWQRAIPYWPVPPTRPTGCAKLLLDADGYCWVPGVALRRSGDESE